ncbi:MAG: SdpI family protein [Candidatus Anstonellaceae archaeon]
MKKLHREILPLLMIALMFAISVYAEPLLKANEKEEIPIHFISGKDSVLWVPRTSAAYLLPIVTLIIYIGLSVIPKIEVYKENLEEFKQQFLGFKILLVFVMCAIHVAALLPSLGYWKNVDLVLIVVISVAILFFYVGYMLNFTKRNYFIGVRTPWTLADERIWEKTNRLAAKLFWICGVLALVGLVVQGDARLWLLIFPAIVTAIIASAYSLYQYLKTKERHKSKKQEQNKRLTLTF